MPSYNRFYQKNKFNAKKTECLGIMFDSKWEAERYGQLVMLQRANHIRDLKTQVRFDITINEQKVCAYIADFTYYEINQDGSVIIQWKHWDFSKQLCFNLFETQNAYLSIGCQGVYHSTFMKSDVKPGKHL